MVCEETNPRFEYQAGRCLFGPHLFAMWFDLLEEDSCKPTLIGNGSWTCHWDEILQVFMAMDFCSSGGFAVLVLHHREVAVFWGDGKAAVFNSWWWNRGDDSTVAWWFWNDDRRVRGGWKQVWTAEVFCWYLQNRFSTVGFENSLNN